MLSGLQASPPIPSTLQRRILMSMNRPGTQQGHSHQRSTSMKLNDTTITTTAAATSAERQHLLKLRNIFNPYPQFLQGQSLRIDPLPTGSNPILVYSTMKKTPTKQTKKNPSMNVSLQEIEQTMTPYEQAHQLQEKSQLYKQQQPQQQKVSSAQQHPIVLNPQQQKVLAIISSKNSFSKQPQPHNQQHQRVFSLSRSLVVQHRPQQQRSSEGYAVRPVSQAMTSNQQYLEMSRSEMDSNSFAIEDSFSAGYSLMSARKTGKPATNNTLDHKERDTSGYDSYRSSHGQPVVTVVTSATRDSIVLHEDQHMQVRPFSVDGRVRSPRKSVEVTSGIRARGLIAQPRRSQGKLAGGLTLEARVSVNNNNNCSPDLRRNNQEFEVVGREYTTITKDDDESSPERPSKQLQEMNIESEDAGVDQINYEQPSQDEEVVSQSVTILKQTTGRQKCLPINLSKVIVKKDAKQTKIDKIIAKCTQNKYFDPAGAMRDQIEKEALIVAKKPVASIDKQSSFIRKRSVFVNGSTVTQTAGHREKIGQSSKVSCSSSMLNSYRAVTREGVSQSRDECAQPQQSLNPNQQLRDDIDEAENEAVELDEDEDEEEEEEELYDEGGAVHINNGSNSRNTHSQGERADDEAVDYKALYLRSLAGGRKPIGGQNLHQIEPEVIHPLLLLKSVYENRPSTVFFQYPPQCGDIVRCTSRTVQATDYEEVRFDLRYKVTTNSVNQCLRAAFSSAGIRSTEGDDWNILWGTGLDSSLVQHMMRYQKLNHFPQCWNMGRKDCLWKNLSKVKRKFPSEYDFIPTTYLLQHLSDWERFLSKRSDAERGKLWIMKPSNQAQGKNIKMISKRSRVQRKEEYIICEYVANPHLIDGLKYDLRIYVLVTSYDPLRVYIFNDGLTRFATEKYSTSTKELSKQYVHLTNYSLNKNNPQFKQNVDANHDNVGSKWSLQALFKKYAEMGIDTTQLWESIKDIIVKTCIAAEPYMTDSYVKCENHRTNCFELYGFDVLIDDTLKPWLLEVNVRPALTSSSPLDRKIKHTLVCDAFNLIGVQPYDKKQYDDDMRKKIPGVSEQKRAGFSKFIKDLDDLDESNIIEKLSPEDWNMLFEMDEENYRTGHFSRIFPPADKEKFDFYLKFFEYERYNNAIVRTWLRAKDNILEKILPKKYHENV